MNETREKKILMISAPEEYLGIKEKLKTEKNIKIVTAKWVDLAFIMDGNNIKVNINGEDIREYSFVWIQCTWIDSDLAHGLSIYLDSVNIPHTPITVNESKLTDLITFSINKLTIPLSFYCIQRALEKNMMQIIETLKYPFVVKATEGSWGRHVYLVNSIEEFKNLIPTLKKRGYVCQQYVPNSFDYRVLFANDDLVSTEKRIRQDDEFRNNISLGGLSGDLRVDELDDQIKELTLKSCNLLNLKWAGVDIITNEKTGEHLILEVNRRPGTTLESLEIVAVEKFLEDIIRDLK